MVCGDDRVAHNVRQLEERYYHLVVYTMSVHTFQLSEDGGMVLGSTVLQTALDDPSCVVLQSKLREKHTH